MLDIYRASAGSGKTYTLTLEYIKMLLGHRDEAGLYRFYRNIASPHRRILAVTFTNKATDEMKQRIIRQLDILAHNTTQSDYCKVLCRAFSCDEMRLQEVAKKVLYQLLHDFSYFNISTIDSFFQQVLRAFTQEVGLQGGFNIEMDSNYVTTSAIDRMFADLEDERNGELLDWLLRYAEENIREGGSWDIYGRNSGRSDIQTLAKQLTSETYKKYRKSLLEKNRNDFKAYIKELREVKQDFLSTLRTYSLQALDAIADAGMVPDDFNHRWAAKLHLFIQQRATFTPKDIETFLKYAENRDKWFSMKKIKELHIDIESLATTFGVSLQGVIDCFGEPYVAYRTAIECAEHIYTLGILADIDRHIAEYEQEHNALLLSKTPEILSGIINESDAPFIYEKMGTRIEHYMIDEFQDTSSLQWQNFAPLVRESMANGNDDLIVGDVKQSIYRWRNSDWRLLHYAFDKPQNAQFVHHEMDTNWRSCAGVVAFNNSFFKSAATILQASLAADIADSSLSPQEQSVPEVESAYSNLFQHVAPANKERCGHVAVHLLELEKNNNDFFTTAVEERIPEMLIKLFEKGYRMGDIAFLVRDNADGKRLVELLLSLSAEGEGALRGLKVVSDEALLITNAPPVKLILGILRYLCNPEAPIYELQLSYEHEMMLHAIEQGESHALEAYFERRHNQKEQEEELQQFIRRIEMLPLYEMSEQIIEYFSHFADIHRYIAYITAFQDIVSDYCRTHSADLYSFLQWWDAKEKSASTNPNNGLTIKSPDAIDAIRVLTIHKSKGLEFPVVIIPYANWTLNREGGVIWCSTQQEPFCQMPVLPLTYRKSRLADTYFAKQYFEERTNNYIDNLNLSYVAFTRAAEELIVYAPMPKPNKSGIIGLDSMEELIYHVFNRTTEETHESLEEVCLSQHCTKENGGMIFETGADWSPVKRHSNMEIAPEKYYKVVTPDKRMRLRLKSHGISGDDIRDYGTLMHNILSEIRYTTDIDKVVQRYVSSGELSVEKADETSQQLHDWLSRPETARWYAHDVTVLAETEILQATTIFYRPDRVVIDGDSVTIIDYKLGNIEREATYRKQVQHYMTLVKEMGYKQVEGVIWYLTLDKIVWI